jgi:DNA mismatch repair protein MutS
VLLAHCGLFVPASEAKIGLVDGIFARVGSGDVIAKNQSTFMTEMIEVANIINNATAQSFVIFDELGRGTSTYDGLSITRAIIEHFATTIGCKVLLATHYHELIALADTFDTIKNYHVGVYESDHDVIFLKKVLPGGMERSYGLEVAKLAGIPKMIVEQAQWYLAEHETSSKANASQTLSLYQHQDTPLFQVDHTLGAEQSQLWNKVRTMIETTDINYLTPVQAMQLVMKMMEMMKG